MSLLWGYQEEGLQRISLHEDYGETAIAKMQGVWQTVYSG